MKNNILRYICVLAIAMGSLIQIGCASGGYKLTRQYSGFVNKQNILIRILLYVFTAPVYSITLLADFVIFNTIDFWEGRVSAGSHSFEKDGNLYAIEHFYSGDKNLRNTKIKIMDKETKNIKQELFLSEKNDEKIHVFIDGKLKTIVDDINSIPNIHHLQNGKVVKTEKLSFVAARK